MNKVRMIIDILMTMLLPVLMAYSLVGEQAHEILGVLMFGLFVVNSMNANQKKQTMQSCLQSISIATSLKK